ncbi:MAG: hypothetical protein ACKEQK_00560 [Candidatus Hodgkinia cicadicola]
MYNPALDNATPSNLPIESSTNDKFETHETQLTKWPYEQGAILIALTDEKYDRQILSMKSKPSLTGSIGTQPSDCKTLIRAHVIYVFPDPVCELQNIIIS